MNAASPGVIALFQPNDFYRTQDAYLEALAEGMRAEYEAIVDRGVLLQIDAPDLAMGRHTMYRDRSVDEFLRLAARHIEVLNHALRAIPPDRVRMHVCWGNYEGPHHHDVPLELLWPDRGQDPRAGPAHRGRQSPPRARVGRLRRADPAGRQDPDPGRRRHDDKLRRASRCWWPSACAASPAWSAASGSSPAPTAGSEPSPASVRSTRTWPTSSCESLAEGARIATERLWRVS